MIPLGGLRGMIALARSLARGSMPIGYGRAPLQAPKPPAVSSKSKGRTGAKARIEAAKKRRR